MMPTFLDNLLRAFVVVVLIICFDDNIALSRAAARGQARPGVRRALAQRILWVGLAVITEVLRFLLQ